MTNDGTQSANATPFLPKEGRTSSWFSVPEPVRRVFDYFPLKTYPANELPRRSPRGKEAATLHVFTSLNSAQRGAPSFNPACLKWQAYLKFNGIDFQTVPSNNHASPTGALPFILPTTSPNSTLKSPVPTNKILKWTASHGGKQEEAGHMRYEAYTSLLDHRIRSAWLFTLYLDDLNFEAVAKKLYIYPASSNYFVRMTLAYQLRHAAREELWKYSSYIDEDDLYAEAAKSFQSLSTLLGDDNNFFGLAQPSLFDASVFAYTQLLLDSKLGWQNKRMSDALRRNANLVHHRQRILDTYFST